MTPTEKLLKLAERYEWQPIESEPTDGEQYLITDGSCVVMAEHPNDERIEHDITSCGFGETTHWMPLPDGKAGGIIRILVDGLMKISCYDDGKVVTSSFDEPASARQAREFLTRASEEL